MKQINRHGAKPKNREKMFFLWNDSAQCENKEKRNSVAAQAHKHAGAWSHTHVFIGVTSVENPGSKANIGCKNTAKNKQENADKRAGEKFPFFSYNFKPGFLEIITCQEKRVEK